MCVISNKAVSLFVEAQRNITVLAQSKRKAVKTAYVFAMLPFASPSGKKANSIESDVSDWPSLYGFAPFLIGKREGAMLYQALRYTQPKI